MPPARAAAAAGVAALSLALCASHADAQKPVARPSPPPRIEGTVRDAAGKPVEKALVMTRPLAGDQFDRTLTARSAANGQFSLAVPRPGEYMLRVEAPGLAPQTIERQVLPASPLNITLRKGGAIEGIVRDAGGRPVAGARVDARAPMRVGTLLSEPEAGLVRTTTGAKGAFRLEGLAVAPHMVTASASGLGGVRRPGVTPGTKLELFLTPGAGVRGTVRAPDRRPLAGATVMIEPEVSGAAARIVERTDDAGTFVVWGLAPGGWRVIGVHPDFAVTVAPLVLEKNVEQRVDVAVGPPTRLRGRLVDGGERPLQGTLFVQELEGRPIPPALAEALRADSDAQGRVTLDRLPRAALALAATARGYAPKRVEAWPDAAEVDLGDIVLDQGLTIRGRVRDAAGHGIPDAQVRAVTQGMTSRVMRLEATTEADGRFVLAGAEPGAYGLQAEASGFASASVRTLAGADPVDIVLQRAGSITGTVIDEKAAAVPIFEVSANPTEQGEDARPAFDEGSDGRFELSDLASGEWVVVVKAERKAEARVSGVKVRTGAVTDIGRVRLSPGATVRGRVTDTGGSPVPGANVWVDLGERFTFVGRFGSRGAFTDGTGAFELLGVEAGRIDLVASHPEYASARLTGVEVDTTRSTPDVRITLGRGGRVEGTARRRDGRPIERAMVRVMGMASGYPTLSAAVTPDGTFTIEHVPPGSARAVLFPDASAFGGAQFRAIEVREGETTAADFLLRDILVTGTVTRRGEPAPGLKVMLRGMRGFYGGGFSTGLVPAAPAGPQRGWALTRQDGGFELLVDDPGAYMATVTSADGRVGYPMRTIEVPDAETATADLAFGGVVLSGQVVDAETAAPVVADVWATPTKGTERRMARTLAGTDGRFQLEVDPGEIGLEAAAKGYAPARTTLTVGEAGATDVRLALKAGASISGRIVDSAGRPVPSVEVIAVVEGGPPPGTTSRSYMGSTRAAPDGTFTFRGLAEGRYALSAGDELSGFGVAPDVEAGSAGVVLRLQPGGRLRATVLRADGSPASSIFAGVTKVDGHPTMGRLFGQTDTAGVADFAVPAGNLEVRAMDQREEGTATVTVPAGETASVEIRLQSRKAGPGNR